MATQKNNTPENTPAATGVSTPEYTPINADKSKKDADRNSLKEVYANDPYHNQAYEVEALLQQMQDAGINTDTFGWRSQQGDMTQNRDEAIAGGGTGEAVPYHKEGTWYEKPGVDRQEAPGTSRADEDHLNDAEYAYVQYCKEKYADAKTAGDRAMMDYWHNEAEKVRAQYHYSGGSDGSTYFTLGELGAHHPYDDYPAADGGYEMSASGVSGSADPSSDLKGLLDAWQETATQQSNVKIDYAVAKAVADLERALADAQPQFKEQAESVDRSARQAMDNAALYAEMRGDKGGIGQEQYNSIQNTQAQNHLTVQQAQTKLATDTQRQIADLRAQGEFEKADAALQITQQYLQQLIGLEQWAAEYNLSVDQFNESVRQWEAEYNMAMQQLQISQNQWQAEFDAAQNQWQQEFDFANQQYQDSLAQWEKEFALEQALAQMKGSSSGSNGKTMTLNQAKSLAEDGVFTPESLAVFYENGYTDDNLKRLYRYTPPVESVTDAGTTSQYDRESVLRLGLGTNVSDAQLDQLLNEGKLKFRTTSDGKIVVSWADGYSYGGIQTIPGVSNPLASSAGSPAPNPNYVGGGGNAVGNDVMHSKVTQYWN